MASNKIPEDRGVSDFIYLSLYRLRSLSDEEKQEWVKLWADIKKKLPKGIKILVEVGSAFGTEFTGFTLYEGPIVQFEKLSTMLEEQTSHVVEKQKTIIGTKGFAAPTSEVQKILDSRPID